MAHQARAAIFLHLTWATWDRLPLLDDNVARGVYRAMSAECERLRVEVLAIGGVEDHVHVLLRLPTTITVAALLKQLKGTSAHTITQQMAPGHFFKWQGGYAAYSVSPRHLKQVIAYIANQREHHRVGTVLPLLEPDAQAFIAEPYLYE